MKRVTRARVILGLGSNIGQREDNIKSCIRCLSEAVDIKSVSSNVETPALLPPNAPDTWDTPFLNCVIIGTTILPPKALLSLCQDIETMLGRPKEHTYWSPRTIDVDILDYEAATLQDETLTLPHPAIAERYFVLFPLTEIAPNWKHPVLGLTARQLLEKLGSA